MSQVFQGKRKRKLNWDDEEEPDSPELQNDAEKTDEPDRSQLDTSVEASTTLDDGTARTSSRQEYLKQRQQRKLEELEKELADPNCVDYDKKAKVYERLKLIMARDTNVSTYTLNSSSEPLSRREKHQLLTSKTRRDDGGPKKLWEQQQLEKVGQVETDDRIHLPGLEKYEFVFDQSQFVDFGDEETYGGEDDLEDDVKPEGDDIQAVRRLLPVYRFRQSFLDAVKANPVIIVVGETGSGKTTQLPQFLYEEGYAKGKIVACTQPRRVAATSVAKRVAEEMNTKLGQKVGYTVRFDDSSLLETAVKFMTDGMLLREFLTDPLLSKYGAIMIDEAHERTLLTEIVLALLKDIIKERTDLKVIVASATINADRFSEYFDGAPILNIPGRRFPVEVHYTLAPEANYIQAALTTIFQIHLTQPLPGDILVFLTGQDEIEQMENALVEALEKLRDNDEVAPLEVCTIYANLPPEQQAKIFEPVPSGTRKVVLATNIAETSITINGISYVIDPGYVKQNVYNPLTGMDSLVVVPSLRASADQRAGRAGRVGPGKCFRLFTKWAYDHELEVNPTPEILRVNLVGTVLLLLSMGITDLVHFDFMDKPLAQGMLKLLELLYALGALNRKGQLTPTGLQMAEFPLPPTLCKALLTASKLNCISEVILIVSMLGESGSLFYRPKDHKEAADNAHKKFFHPRGDHYMLLSIWNEFVDLGFSKLWCQDHFVQYKTLKRVKDVRTQVEGLCDKIGLDVHGEQDDIDESEREGLIEKALISGFFANIVRLLPMGDSYKQVKALLGNAGTVLVHPSLCVYPMKPPPKWLLYYELVLTSKEYLRNCMVITDPRLIETYGGHYYKPDQLK